MPVRVQDRQCFFIGPAGIPFQQGIIRAEDISGPFGQKTVYGIQVLLCQIRTVLLLTAGQLQFQGTDLLRSRHLIRGRNCRQIFDHPAHPVHIGGTYGNTVRDHQKRQEHGRDRHGPEPGDRVQERPGVPGNVIIAGQEGIVKIRHDIQRVPAQGQAGAVLVVVRV